MIALDDDEINTTIIKKMMWSNIFVCSCVPSSQTKPHLLGFPSFSLDDVKRGSIFPRIGKSRTKTC